MFSLLLVSRKRPLSHTFLLGYHALVSCGFHHRPTTCPNHFSTDWVPFWCTTCKACPMDTWGPTSLRNPVTKSIFAFQPRQKMIHFICSPILSCLWKFLQNHKNVSITNTDYVGSLKESVSCSRQVKSGSNKWGNRKRLKGGRHTFEGFGYHSCKNLCWEIKRFHVWRFYPPLRCYKLADKRLFIIDWNN